MNKIKVMTALVTLLSPALTIPVNAEETTVNNETSSTVAESTENNEATTENNETTNNNETTENTGTVEADAATTLSTLFPTNPVLADEIASRLGVAVTDTVTQADLDTVQSITLSPRQILVDGNLGYYMPMDLNNVNLLTNLMNLTLNNTLITDLAPISNMNIEILTIDNRVLATNFASLAPVQSLAPTLKQFVFAGHPEANFSFLSSLTNLEMLALDNNELSSPVTSVKSLTNLKALYLSNNYLDESDLARMLPANLDYLNVDGNSVFDLSGLSNIASVSAEYQIGFYIVDKYSTADLASKRLYGSNPIVDISGAPLAPHTIHKTTGLDYNAAENNLYFNMELQHNSEVGFTFNAPGTEEIQLPALGNILSEEEARATVAEALENEFETNAANTFNRFSGVVIYKFKATDAGSETPTEGTSGTGSSKDKLPETGINNYGVLAGSGSLAASAVAMLIRRKIRK